MTPAEPEASVRKLPATDACAVMPNFLGPFSLKYMLLIAADRVVRRKPGMIGRVHRSCEPYGRANQAHLAPEFADNHLD